jgi:predicted O-linked N-acetylglucosamine transferase (SPINDLY family)
MLDYLPGRGAEVGTGFREHQEERRRWYERHAARFASEIVPHANNRDPERRLRVGYISPYMMRNSFGTWLFRPLIRKHDRSRFEVFLYSDVKTPDRDTQSFRDTDSVWRETVRFNDEALADLIRKDQIDILVDLTGHASANRLLTFARKPAPVQISAWGHPTGTGLPVMDYLFADPVAVPEDVRPLFAETVVDLPCFLGYEPPEYAPAIVSPPAAEGRPMTFGCLNRLSKITARCLGLWSRLLSDMPNTRLVLKDPQLSDPRMRSRIAKVFIDCGINEDRLTFLTSTPHDQHLAAYNEIDIALDPFPQSGGVSTFEALWMGVPVVALLGPSVSGRGAAAILSSLGLQDWVADSEDTYLALAKRKASDIPALAELRRGLRPLMAGSPAADSSQYTRAVEAAYREVWRSYCQSGGIAR